MDGAEEEQFAYFIGPSLISNKVGVLLLFLLLPFPPPPPCMMLLPTTL